ncbi:hypothetical protein BN1723_007417 [Verticillium longisporum]|uniref:BZIP domain-containing protein n=1 Tax=Verticillium longisporum TaxID=100787 RepID=A0A0G4NLB2_VERLO|nr:hypothetical protein BN1723_007417 [Verticillium longisporum]
MISVVSNSELKDETPKVTVRRLKKRESNRNAQHAARERTKSRIAHLEELVAHLSNNNTNAEVPYLMKCLLQTSHERDKLFGVLASLSTMIRHHTDGLTASQEDESPRAVVAAMQVIRDRSQQNVSVKPFHQQKQTQEQAQVHNHVRGYREPYVSSDPHMQQDPSGPPPLTYGWGFEISDLHQQHQHPPNTTPVPRNSSRDFDQLPRRNPIAIASSDLEFSSKTNILGEHYTVPSPTGHLPCKCLTIIEPPPGHPRSSSNREANSALGKSFQLLDAEDVEADDRSSQDMPVRAIVEGWNSIERAVRRRGALGPLEMMHLLICYHSDPSPERLATLPRWYHKRPSQQAIPHPYAVNFLVWNPPGPVSASVLSSHSTATSGFDGCFMQNAATGRFELAPLFEERIRDIKAWTMNADILNQYPELADDIPLFTGLPATPSTPQNAFGQQQARWTTMPRPIKGDADEPAELVPQQQQQRKQAEDELAKGSALIVTTQAPAFADEEVRFQCPNVYMTMAGQPTHTYGQSGFIEPIPLAPTVPGPGGQHVYVGGLCFDMYC